MRLVTGVSGAPQRRGTVPARLVLTCPGASAVAQDRPASDAADALVGRPRPAGRAPADCRWSGRWGSMLGRGDQRAARRRRRGEGRAMADLPTGTVTFLYTDLEGSTALWERAAGGDAGGRRPPRRAAARGDRRAPRPRLPHRRRRAVRRLRHRPRRRRRRAGRPAGAARRAWGEIGPLRVRMALHTGAAELSRTATTSAPASTGSAGCWRPATAGRCCSRRRPPTWRATRCRRAPACATWASTGCATWSSPEPVYQLRPRRPAGRLPAAALARRLPAQPAAAADQLRRPRARDGRGRRAAGDARGC